MKKLAAIVGTAVVLSLALHANAQVADPKVADAKPGDVRVIVTAAIREPLNAVLKQAEAAIGKPIVAEYGSARGNLKDQILKGQDFEVAILLPDVDDEMQAAGKIAPGRFEIARVPAAFGLRGEARNLDVSSPAAVQAAMLNAKSVRYAPTGAALMTVKKILSTLDIAVLTVGSTLYLPVFNDGALFYTGDPHGVQADGEVDGGALEQSLRDAHTIRNARCCIGASHREIPPQRPTPWLGISDSNFDVQSENSSL
jgi:acetamidase/formamidase